MIRMGGCMECFKISERLKKVASLINKGNVVADIGTDHGYLPIYIVKQGISNRVIAMDVRKKPLEKAKSNVSEHNVSDMITLRLSDGLSGLEAGEAGTITICGMGGKLIQSILEKGRDKYDDKTQLIVSPQSEIREFRIYLRDNGFKVNSEYMIEEDNQFYLIIDCVLCEPDRGEGYMSEECIGDDIDALTYEAYLRYGESLLKSRNPALKLCLEHDLKVREGVLEKVLRLNSQEEAVHRRISELSGDINCINKALQYYA